MYYASFWRLSLLVWMSLTKMMSSFWIWMFSFIKILLVQNWHLKHNISKQKYPILQFFYLKGRYQHNHEDWSYHESHYHDLLHIIFVTIIPFISLHLISHHAREQLVQQTHPHSQNRNHTQHPQSHHRLPKYHQSAHRTFTVRNLASPHPQRYRSYRVSTHFVDSAAISLSAELFWLSQ